MKKLIMTIAVAASLMITGQINAQLSADNKGSLEQTKQTEFQEIRIAQLPAAVIKAVKTNFEKAVIGKAYVNELHHYKLLLEIDGMEQTIYANAKGEWIKPKK